jgi:hypothetical protein
MIWAVIGLSIDNSELIIMDRDPEALRGGYTAISYTNTLEEGLVPLYDGQVFMQDNAPIHTARHTLDWLDRIGIYVHPDWPPYSPDMNPIEHIWMHLKQAIYEIRPGLDGTQNKTQQREALLKVLPLAWKAIKLDVFKGVLESMPRRIEALIDARGWHTKY